MLDFRVPIVNDEIAEPTEHLQMFIKIDNGKTGGVISANLMIMDDDMMGNINNFGKALKKCNSTPVKVPGVSKKKDGIEILQMVQYINIFRHGNENFYLGVWTILIQYVKSNYSYGR